MRRSWLRLTLALLIALSGCQQQSSQSFNSVDITGANYAHDFSLTDHNGNKRTLADFRGKVVLVFFGYTQCPDVCPTTMADMAQVKAKLGSAGDKLQVVFISVDPERDTQALLAQYVPSFDRSFIGLYGTPDEIARTAKEFKVIYQKVPGKTPTSYSIDHTAGSYLFDPQGRVRLFVKHSQSIDSIVEDVKRLLQ
ncbi:MAG TPA: SCO family protein [Burkholderiaceae bacterium]|nr:SCO family protein [Burkholderiaceae bacterium]